MTAPWKGWPTASCRSSPSSTIRRPGRGPGTTSTSSGTSSRRSRGRRPRHGGGAMPKREDVKTAMVIGSGPIVIGQAAEFDYSGAQACRSLREEGVRVILVNSNPATIQTDPETADAVYVEPLTVEFLEKVIAKERPQGILSGMGGQTALNLCSELADAGILQRHGVELLGTKLEAIAAGENRERFASLMRSIGEPIPRSRAVSDSEAARAFVEEMGYPVIVRAAYTLGGSGSGVAHSPDELDRIVALGLAYSRIKQVLVEESVLGWKEFEYEVMRDAADNCITICSMENLDPMGVHTGESIVVAPAQTLSDSDHQTLRSAALRIIRALGVEGGCNIQFAVHPKTGEYRVIEVNPRVSRSSALASKATGYPLARIAAKIAIGLRLDEIPNPVTGKTLASFEPTLDYVVTKIPRWPFDKFPTVDRRIGTSMKSTGEVMAIGRTFEEYLMNAVLSSEYDRVGLESNSWSDDEIARELQEPTDQPLFAIAEALRRGFAPEKIAMLTAWDPFFIEKIRHLVDLESRLRGSRRDRDLLAEAKRLGLPDESIASLTGAAEETIRRMRPRVAYKLVDTCRGEFEARHPYFYSTYETSDEAPRLKGRKVLIVGSGPIRIGQGVEFDYCCVHGILALREAGVAAIIANNNPETVSTDFDISTRLYFEPLLLEDVLNIIEEERPDGVILQFGGQTSINLAIPLARALSRRRSRTRTLGTPPASIDLAEDRRKFSAMLGRLRIRQPEAASGYSFDEVRDVAARIGYPVLVRPSYVLGGRGMEIVHGEEELARFMETAVRVSTDHPVLVDRYLSHATEIDVDAVADGRPADIDTILGPEMKSTGEVMGIDRSLGRAYYKAMLAAGNSLPRAGAVYLTVRDEDKPTILPVAERLVRIGLRIFATRGTAQFLREHGVDATTVYRISENQSPDALGLMRHGEIRLVINTPTNSSGARRDGYMMRRLAADLNIPLIATVQAAEAAVQAIEEATAGDLDVAPLQAYGQAARKKAGKL